RLLRGAHVGPQARQPVLDAADEVRRARDLALAERLRPTVLREIFPTLKHIEVAVAQLADGMVDEPELEALVLDQPEHLVDEKPQRREHQPVEEDDEEVHQSRHAIRRESRVYSWGCAEAGTKMWRA